MSSVKNISLYIPHIFANISKTEVAEEFEYQDIGKVSNIDFILKTGQDGKPYNAAYIHFERWFDTISAANFQSKVLDPSKEARLMYEDPWYWIVLENKARKVASGDRKPRIDLGNAKSISSANLTPEKPKTQAKCPGAPVKKSYAQAIGPVDVAKRLDKEFESDKIVPNQSELNALAEQIEDEAAMEEIEAMMDEEDSNLVYVDGRYLEAVEVENAELRNQIAMLQSMLATEQVKCQTFAEALKLLK